MSAALKSMKPERISAILDKFEQQFEDLDVSRCVFSLPDPEYVWIERNENATAQCVMPYWCCFDNGVVGILEGE